jgi:hypothetical protein
MNSSVKNAEEKEKNKWADFLVATVRMATAAVRVSFG